MSKTKLTLAVTVPIEIDQQFLSDTVVVAVEGGCNYWCSSIRVFDSEGNRTNLVELTENDENLIGRCRIVFTEGVEGSVNSVPEDHTLDLVSLRQLKQGLVLMANDHPQHFANLISDNGDAETADVLVQLTLLGEIRYA